MNIHFPAGLGDLLVGGVLLGVADVLLDGAVEEDGLLTHDPDIISEPADIEVPQILTVQQNLAAVRIVKSLDELDTSGLATARGPNLQNENSINC